MSVQTVFAPESRNRLASRFLAHGLPALVVGGALLIAAVWWLTLQLAGTLAVAHVERKMADVADKARGVLVQPLAQDDKRQALAWLARFRDVQRLELRGSDGALLWRNHRGAPQVRHTLPAPGGTVIEQRGIDGLVRSVARHHAVMQVQGRRVHLLLEADVTDMLASYRQVAVLVAKALTTALLAAIFMMGWLLILRWREQRALAGQLQRMLAQKDVTRGDDDGEWQQAIAEMSSRNAALLRRMVALVERDGAAVTQRREQHANGGRQAAQARQRSA